MLAVIPWLACRTPGRGCRALAGGASGFVLKTGDPHDIIAGVRAAAYLSTLVAKRVVEHLSGSRPRLRTTERIAGLTDREREVLGLVSAGMSNAEIARRLHIVEGTVKVYVSTILRELDVRNRVQAAIVAYESGLVRPSMTVWEPRSSK